MEVVPVDVRFDHCVTFIPHRGRSARTHSLTGETAVGLRSIRKNETKVAYRLHYPQFDPRPLYKRAKKSAFDGNTINTIGRAVDIEVISYAGSLWSPMCGDLSDPDIRENDMAQFLEVLGDGSELSAMETPGIPRDDGAIDVARTIVAHGYDATSLSAAKRIYENFLICDDVPYVRRGVPLYVKQSLSKTVSEIVLGDTPPDRAIELDPCVQSSRSWDYDNEDLRSGSMWLPHQREAAQAAAHPLQNVIPSIHMMVDAPSIDHLVHIRVDALARETARILRGRSTRGWSSKFARPIGRQFDSACELGGSDDEMSSRRLYALQLVHERLASETRGPRLREIKKALTGLLKDIQIGLFPDPRLSLAGSSCGLTKAEEAALESFL